MIDDLFADVVTPHLGVEVWQVIGHPRGSYGEPVRGIEAKKIDSRLAAVYDVRSHVEFGET
jgi:hypothetical protein